jgi:hypothetical protein
MNQRTGIVIEGLERGSAEWRREYAKQWQALHRTPEEQAEWARRKERRAVLSKEERQREVKREVHLRRREHAKTPEGRAEVLAERRVGNWALGLRMSLKGKVRRGHMASQKGRPLEFSPDLTTQWIRDQFERQGGRCFYTGIPFVIEATRRGMRRPSIDRRDSAKGYTTENVVLCLVAFNYLKNDYAEADVMALLAEIRSTKP